MAMLICRIIGARGRSIDVYDNKCVITTDVTVGSLLTSNALDGQKTIFYIDVQGIQYKRSGLTLGYLQLETSSVQMNNQSSNMFSENTFTFDGGGEEKNAQLMDALHDYVVDRIESYKYHTPAQEQLLFDLIIAAHKVPTSRLNPVVIQYACDRQEELEQQRQQELAEQKAREEEAKRLEAEALRQAISESGEDSAIKTFVLHAANCTRVAQILDLWKSMELDSIPGTSAIAQKINDALRVERMYGSDDKDLKKLLTSIQQML